MISSCRHLAAVSVVIVYCLAVLLGTALLARKILARAATMHRG